MSEQTNNTFADFRQQILEGTITNWDDVSHCVDSISSKPHQRINADPENVCNGLVKLVLTILEIVRKLMVKQALRRVDSGVLSEEEIENLGLTLMKLEEKMNELKKQFDIKDDDLTLDLGPLGRIE